MEYLLKSNTAKRLYSSVKDLPIIDYHNHLSLSEIAEDKRFTNIYDLWIKPDPYKHRVMRMCGVDEYYITGGATDFEKFRSWCEIFPRLIGNQLYIWSKMELEKIFGITEVPNKENAELLYKKANDYLANNEITPVSLMNLFNVEITCPCTSVLDDLSVFGGKTVFAPSLRGDDIVNVSKSFVNSLESIVGKKINTLSDYKIILEQRLDDLEAVGLKFADHALDNGFIYFEDDEKNEDRFLKMLSEQIGNDDYKRLCSYILTFLGQEYAKRKIVLQLHIGAQRKTSSRLRDVAGPAGGFAGIGNSVNVESLILFLDTLDCFEYGLPKILLFTLNPSNNALFSVLSGSFSKNGSSGIITQGPAWWWCDHKYGISEALENTMSFGLLSNFVGMTTDSRSYLSFVRHDYFRRILCDYLAEKYENNELACQYEDLEALVKIMCYDNASSVFRMD